MECVKDLACQKLDPQTPVIFPTSKCQGLGTLGMEPVWSNLNISRVHTKKGDKSSVSCNGTISTIIMLLTVT